MLVAVAFTTTTAHISPAEDGGSTAVRELEQSPDFRVRVNAALVLGRRSARGAREVLERSLGDAHPSVRSAAATALGALGDAMALGALERRLSIEPSESVKAQLRVTIERLRSASQPPLSPEVRFVVRLGTMRNAAGVRGDEVRRVLHDAARARARALRGAAVIESDASLLQQAAERHLPVITIDGNVTQLTESRVAGNLEVQARVEFTVRHDQTLKGTLSGGATTFGSGPSISDQGRRQLQDDAVAGAVQSALRGVEQGLMVAAL
jgi:hypothetical protein